ncbi:MAG: hypothetical protein JJ978_17125 [Roseivirga sp.]|jgi:hypothetical protein|uniref:hypothetical protein n=1 Tax=Roseivirga sp. TaxID=1964215 RepID=UPI001B199A0A|nr:hypothetical protein [Roseivirga sp.]MBO6497290.1 hypothetical protein [Roseivirga sp.]
MDKSTLKIACGFTLKANNVSDKKSFELQPLKALHKPDPAVKRMEHQVVQNQGIQLTEKGEYPKKLFTKHQLSIKKEAALKRSQIPIDQQAKTEGSDYEKYGVSIPRYTNPERGSEDFISGDRFDPVQTLFRYDPETLNHFAEKKFYENPENSGKDFTKPHDPNSEVYEGFLDREGTKNMVRVWRFDKEDEDRIRKGEKPLGTPRRGDYYIDVRDLQIKTGFKLDDALSNEFVESVRTVYSIPTEPNRLNQAESKSWGHEKNDIFTIEIYPRKTDIDEPIEKGTGLSPKMVKISKTIDGGEQIIGDKNNFIISENTTKLAP